MIVTRANASIQLQQRGDLQKELRSAEEGESLPIREESSAKYMNCVWCYRVMVKSNGAAPIGAFAFAVGRVLLTQWPPPSDPPPVVTQAARRRPNPPWLLLE